MMLAIFATAVSAALILWLCLGDPKRRRALRLAGEGQGASTRRLIAAAACLPGLLCILLGDAAAFLIWLGGSGAAGWLIAMLLAKTPATGARR